MRIAVLDQYTESSSENKDPVLIPNAISQMGHEVMLVNVLDHVVKDFDLAHFTVQPSETWVQAQKDTLNTDVAIVISRFSSKVLPLIRTINSLGIPIIIKGDTDGTIGFPLTPNYLRTRPILKNPLNLLRHAKWRFPSRHYVGLKLEQINLAQRVVVESPPAVVNLFIVLHYWRLSRLAERVRFIPNPLPDCVTTAPVATERPRKIIAVGRWDDVLVKGTDLLAQVINNIIKSEHTYYFTVIGPGSDKLKRRLDCRAESRVRFFEQASFLDVQQELQTARILLSTSRLESFSFVCAEALAHGCSIAVTPIESLMYLTGGGRFGSVSRDFTPQSIIAALLFEVQRWEQESHIPTVISHYWREKLNVKAVGNAWNDLINSCQRITDR